MVHQVVKPEKIAAVAAVLLEQNLVVPGVFQREGIDQFKGADDDTINVVVEGILPYRSYGWRNDRSASLQFDEYKERKIPVTFGGDIYSGVRLTDEQNDFDLEGWTKLARKQTEAIGSGLEAKAIAHLLGADYEVILGVPEEYAEAGLMRRALIRAREALNKLRAPGATRTLLVGTEWEAALLEDEKLNLASNVGESEAVSSLREATIGRRYGFDIVVAPELPANEAYALVDSAFIFATGAPSVPQSVPFGATASHNGVALTWLRDYETEKRRDRSVFNTYQGFRSVTDVLAGVSKDGSVEEGEYEHFVRAIKLELGGDTVIPQLNAGTSDAKKKENEIAKLTGINQLKALAPVAVEDDEAPETP